MSQIAEADRQVFVRVIVIEANEAVQNFIRCDAHGRHSLLESYEVSVIFMVQGHCCAKETTQETEIGAVRGHCARQRQRQAGQGFRQRGSASGHSPANPGLTGLRPRAI